MSLQEMTCLESSLFYKGCFKLMEDSLAVNAFIDSLEEHFITPKENWPTINRIFGLYGFSAFMSQGSPSKNEDAGDGSKAPWSAPNNIIGCMVTIFNAFEKLNLLVDPDSLRITYNANPEPEERKILQIWKAIFTKYGAIKEVEIGMITMAYILASQYLSNSRVTYSPAQINLFSNSLIKAGINEWGPEGSGGYSATAKVPWETIDIVLAQAISKLHSPWEISMSEIETVNPTYTSRLLEHYVVESNLETGALPLNFSSGMLYHIEKILIVRCYTESSGEDTIIVQVPDCYGVFGSRPDVQAGFYCALKPGPSQDVDDPDNPGETINVPVLINACPYKESCVKSDYLQPTEIDYTTGKLVLKGAFRYSIPHIKGSAVGVNDFIKIYYKTVSI